MTQIADILLAARATLVSDLVGLGAIAALTVGLLHLPGFV